MPDTSPLSPQDRSSARGKRGKRASAPAREEWLELHGTPDSLPRIRQAVVDMAHECHLSSEDAARVEMAVGEACTNIIEHAYSTQNADAELKLHLVRFDDRLEIVIHDCSSINFAVDRAHTVDGIDDWIASGRRRGLGIFIIQSFVDKVDHRFVCGRGNELKLTKYFGS